MTDKSLTNIPIDEIRLLTVAETAKILRVSTMSVYRMIDNKILAACKAGRIFRVYEESVRQILERPARRGSRSVRKKITSDESAQSSPAWIIDAWNQGAGIDAISKAAQLPASQVKEILREAGIQA